MSALTRAEQVMDLTAELAEAWYRNSEDIYTDALDHIGIAAVDEVPADLVDAIVEWYATRPAFKTAVDDIATGDYMWGTP